VIELNPSLLARSPEETARRLCLGLLTEADAALARLERGEDPEALHDFRVALRRLRSVARAYRPYLKGSLKRKLRGRLADLADATNAARDLEVQNDWLATHSPELEPEARAGAARLSERLRSRGSGLERPDQLRRSFDALNRALLRSLSRSRIRLEEDASFLEATAELLSRQAALLKESLNAIGSGEEAEKLHRARIEAKRLRYLLEPVGARSLVKVMKPLQDVLGELQDTRVLSESIATEIERDAVEQAHRLRELALREDAGLPSGPPADPGFLALLREQRERRDRLYASLSASWLSARNARFIARVKALARRLRRTPGRRLFLLREVPEKARRLPPWVVRQAILPGKRIRERVESIQSGDRTRFVRVAISNGTRTEERISQETFERFRSLSSRRLESARYRLRERGRTLWIHESGGLVLAETEGPLPEWLEPYVTREVTGSRRFEPEALAHRASSLGS
jgi:CHAD domain-containing protein